MVIEHLRQVDAIARQMYRRLPRHVCVEDLISAGALGLMDAIQKFDCSKHVQFKSYAKFRIRGAILDSLRELDWGSRAVRREARRIAQVENDLSFILQRTPTEAEIAENLHLELRDLQSLMAQIQALQITSVTSARTPENRDVYDQLPAPADDTPYVACLRSEMRELLERLMAGLPANERRVMALYYFEELTMHEIGNRIGIGESRVSQLHSSALRHLREASRGLIEKEEVRQRKSAFKKGNPGSGHLA